MYKMALVGFVSFLFLSWNTMT